MKLEHSFRTSILVVCTSLILGCGANPNKEEVVYVEVDPGCPIADVSNAAIGPSVFIHSSRPGNQYEIGELLNLSLSSSADSYLSLYHVSSSCKVSEMLSNKRVRADKTIGFPGSSFKLRVRPPEGNETFVAVATKKPLRWLAREDYVTRGQVSQLALEPTAFSERLESALHRKAPNEWGARSLVTSISHQKSGSYRKVGY